MHNTLRSEKTKLLLLALSLATLDIWGDMKGASALFVQINSIVGSALINGRMIGLTGIAICSAIAALKPSIVLFSRSSLSVVPSLAAICSALFFFAPLDKRKSSGRKRSNHLSCRFLLRMVRGHDPRTSLHQLLKRTKAPLRNCAQHCA